MAEGHRLAAGSAHAVTRAGRRGSDGGTPRETAPFPEATRCIQSSSCKSVPRAGEEAEDRSGEMLNFILETKRKHQVFGTNTGSPQSENGT